MAHRRHLLLLPLLYAAACNTHPLSKIESETFVEARDEIPQIGREVPVVDILFMIDNSGSMEEEQRNLTANFGEFIRIIQETGADFRIAVVSSDMQNPNESGRFLAKFGNPKILDNNTPNLETVFRENASLGTMGDGFEKGLQAVETALSEPLLSGDNAGFLREGAVLAVVFLADEEDCSHPPGAIPEFDGDECVRNISRMYPVQRYVDFLTSVKGGSASKVFVAAIVGPEIAAGTERPQCTTDASCASGKCADGRCCLANPALTTCTVGSDCQSGETCVGKKCFPSQTRRPYPPRDCSCFASGTGLAEPGTRYIDMVRAFPNQSVYASVCAADWSASLREIGGGVAQLLCQFPLEHLKANPNARPESERDIVVKIRAGATITEAAPGSWSYVCPDTSGPFSKGSIRFTTCPPANTAVQILYEPASNDTPPQTCGARNPAGTCPTGRTCGNCGYCE